MTDAVRAIVATCEAHNVRRIVMLSTFTLERDRLTAFTKVLSGITMRSVLKDGIWIPEESYAAAIVIGSLPTPTD